jgi:SanA protein
MKNKKILLSLILLSVLSPFLINLFIFTVSANNIYFNINETPLVYTALVLGAAVYKNGRPSPILQDRLQSAVELYRAGKIERVLVSGDHGKKYYDEVNAMRNYLIQRGVNKNDIFMDHAGFRTYDSIIRAKKVFLVEDIIVVTQEYHLYRSVFIGKFHGITTYGFISDKRNYLNIKSYKFREFFARVKAFTDILTNKEPKFPGPEIPINGKNTITLDQP